MSDEQELKPLWYEDKDPEGFDIMDSEVVIYNLYEDVKCQKEELEQLRQELEESRQSVSDLEADIWQAEITINAGDKKECELAGYVESLREVILTCEVDLNYPKINSILKEAPTQSLQQYRDSVIEECAKACEIERCQSGINDMLVDASNETLDGCIEAIRALKEK